MDVIAQLKAINGAALRILAKNRDVAPDTALRAIAEVRRQIELQAKLLGDLDERPVVNVLLNAEWIEIKGAIVSALEPHPDARDAVVQALTGLEGGGGRDDG